MIIETDRLLLKPYNFEDLDNYHKLMSNELVWTYSTNVTHDSIMQSEHKLKDLILSHCENFIGFHALFDKSNTDYIGEAGILSYNPNANRCVVGYNLLPEFWRNGYATEINKALIDFAFEEIKVERVEALVQETNIASCKVLEKSGMHLEGILRNFTRVRGVYENVCYYSIITSDQKK